MSKSCTPSTGAINAARGRHIQGPKAITLAIIRQFARAYAPVNCNMPGIVLN